MNALSLQTVLRWAARLLGLASGLLLLAFALGGGEHMRPTVGEAVALMLFPGGLILGFAVAWWRELAGALIAVTSFGLFFVYMYAWSGQWLGVYFYLFAAPAFLQLASALLARRSTNMLVAVGQAV